LGNSKLEPWAPGTPTDLVGTIGLAPQLALLIFYVYVFLTVQYLIIIVGKTFYFCFVRWCPSAIVPLRKTLYPPLLLILLYIVANYDGAEYNVRACSELP